MDTEALKALCERVAAHLSGHSTRVYFQHPARVEGMAECGRRDGKAFINIQPGLFYRNFIYCLCHEAAHIKQLWSGWDRDLPEYKPASIAYPEWAKRLPIVGKIERDADAQAEVWLQFADDVAFFKSGDWLLIRLNALLNWKG